MAAAMTGGDSSQENPYQAVIDRCQKLELSQEGMRKHIESLSNRICDDCRRRRRRRRTLKVEMTSDSGRDRVNGTYFCGNPYKNVLQCMGHAVWVTRPDSGEIIFWNQAAEKLFGYKSKEFHEKKFTSLHVDEEYILVSKKIMERLKHGGTWSGQFPLKKKTGEIFMALMTQSPLFEEENGGEFVGIITVASDAAVFNSQESSSSMKKKTKKNSCSTLNNNKKMNGLQDDDDDRVGYRGVRGLNLKRISWDYRPQITSFVSDLVHLKKRGEDNNNQDDNKEENVLENSEIKCVRPPRIPVRKQIILYSQRLL